MLRYDIAYPSALLTLICHFGFFDTLLEVISRRACSLMQPFPHESLPPLRARSWLSPIRQIRSTAAQCPKSIGYGRRDDEGPILLYARPGCQPTIRQDLRRRDMRLPSRALCHRPSPLMMSDIDENGACAIFSSAAPNTYKSIRRLGLYQYRAGSLSPLLQPRRYLLNNARNLMRRDIAAISRATFDGDATYYIYTHVAFSHLKLRREPRQEATLSSHCQAAVPVSNA